MEPSAADIAQAMEFTGEKDYNLIRSALMTKDVQAVILDYFEDPVTVRSPFGCCFVCR